MNHPGLVFGVPKEFRGPDKLSLCFIFHDGNDPLVAPVNQVFGRGVPDSFVLCAAPGNRPYEVVGTGLVFGDGRIAKDLADCRLEDGLIVINDLPFKAVGADRQVQPVGLAWFTMRGHEKPLVVSG